MCGIVAYIGNQPAQDILVQGLKRLEYRGYDSSGLAITNDNKMAVIRSVGRIANLEEKLINNDMPGSVGIAHTRWATHGAPVEKNAHPHCDYTGKIAVVHNGIIENYNTLKKWLISKQATFSSDTDTEVIANMLGYFYSQDETTSSPAAKLEKALRTTLIKLAGTFGIAILCQDLPDTIMVARRGSPLVIGVGDDEFVIASDAAAIVKHTTQAVYLNDNEIAIVNRQGYKTSTIDNQPVTSKIEQIEYCLEEIELAQYEHYMQKEIFEQPETLRAAMSGRIDINNKTITLGGIADMSRQLVKARKINISACGTALHAGMVAKYLLEELASLPVETDYASEFRYRNPIINEGTVQIVVSQSGETIDTLAALREAHNRGAMTMGIVNSVGSTIARETDCGIYLHVGPEIGVASTKAFTGQLAVFTMLALYIARRRHMSQYQLEKYIDALVKIPDQIESILKQSDYIREVTSKYCDRENWLFLARGYQYPVALEGALKLKEISYIHAEGLPAAEMKHGPIALITPEMPVVFIATKSDQYEKVLGNMEEVKARGGQIIAVATQGDRQIQNYADHIFYIPDTMDELQPMLTVIPLQLLAYHAAVIRGMDVDKPRNLAKSVTVE